MKPKFEVGDLLPIGLTIVVLSVGISFGLNVLGDIKADSCDNGCTWTVANNSCINDTSPYEVCGSPASLNATSNAIDAVAKIPAKLGIIVSVIITAVLIGILIRYLMIRYA